MITFKYLKKKFCILFLLLFFKICFVEASTPISSCGVTITSPGYYYLTRNLTVSSGGRCITISTNNVIIDGRGFSIINNGVLGNESGIFYDITTSDRVIINNITIRNISFYNFSGNGSAIFFNAFSSSNNATIRNIIIRDVLIFRSRIVFNVSYNYYFYFGFIENISFLNINIQNSSDSHVINIVTNYHFQYYEDPFTGELSCSYYDASFVGNITFSNLTIHNANNIIFISSLVTERLYFENFSVINSTNIIIVDRRAFICSNSRGISNIVTNLSLENFNIINSRFFLNLNGHNLYNSTFSNFLLVNCIDVFSGIFYLVDVSFNNFTILNTHRLFLNFYLSRSRLYNITIFNLSYFSSFFPPSYINESVFDRIYIYNSNYLFNISLMRNSNFSNIYVENSSNIFYSEWISYLDNNLFYNITIKNSSHFINYRTPYYYDSEGNIHYGACYDGSNNRFINFYIENSRYSISLSTICSYRNYLIENITIFNSSQAFSITAMRDAGISRWQIRNIQVYNSPYERIFYAAAGGGFSSSTIENIYIYNSSGGFRLGGDSFSYNIVRNITLNFTGDKAFEINTGNYNRQNNFSNIIINNCNGSTGCIVLGYISVDENNISNIYIYNSSRAFALSGSGSCEPDRNIISNAFIYNSSLAIRFLGDSMWGGSCDNRFFNILIYNSPRAIEIRGGGSVPNRNNFSYIYIYDTSPEYSIVFDRYPRFTNFECVIPYNKINISIVPIDINGLLYWNDTSNNTYRCFNKVVNYNQNQISITNFYPRTNVSNFINVYSFFRNLIESIQISKNPLNFNDTANLIININHSTLQNLFSSGFVEIPIFIVSNDTNNTPASNFTLLIISPFRLVVVSNESSIELKPGGNRTINITVLTNYITNNISLFCENLPTGLECLFSRERIPYNSSSLLTIFSDSKLQSGTYRISIIARDLERYIWNFTEILVIVPEIPKIVSIAIRQYIIFRGQEFLVESPIKVFTISKFRIEIINNGTIDLQNLELKIFNSRNSIFFNYENRMLEKREKIFIDYLEAGKSKYIDFYIIPARFGSDVFNINIYQENKLLANKNYIFEYIKNQETIIVSEKLNMILVIIIILLFLVYIF